MDEMKKIKIIKLLMLAFTIAYVVSPVDLCPGPIDDLIMVMLSLAAQKKMKLPV